MSFLKTYLFNVFRWAMCGLWRFLGCFLIKTLHKGKIKYKALMAERHNVSCATRLCQMYICFCEGLWQGNLLKYFNHITGHMSVGLENHNKPRYCWLVYSAFDYTYQLQHYMLEWSHTPPGTSKCKPFLLNGFMSQSPVADTLICTERPHIHKCPSRQFYTQVTTHSHRLPQTMSVSSRFKWIYLFCIVYWSMNWINLVLISSSHLGRVISGHHLS